jgi:hypothetical protein
MAPVGFFLRGLLPQAVTGSRRDFRRTRGNPSGARGFCRFVRLVAIRCGSLLHSRCTAFCTTGIGDLRPSGGGGRSPGRRRLAPAHHILEVVLPRHQVVLGRELRRMTEPLRDHVQRILLDPVGLARGPQILQEPRPGRAIVKSCVQGSESGGVLQDSVGEDSSFENKNDLVMGVESSPASAG